MAVGDRVRRLRDRDDVPLGSVGVILGVIFGVPRYADEIAVKFDGKSLVVTADDVELVEAD